MLYIKNIKFWLFNCLIVFLNQSLGATINVVLFTRKTVDGLELLVFECAYVCVWQLWIYKFSKT